MSIDVLFECTPMFTIPPYTIKTHAGCYGELAAQAGGNGIDPAFFQAIDRICPGMCWIWCGMLSK